MIGLGVDHKGAGTLSDGLQPAMTVLPCYDSLEHLDPSPALGSSTGSTWTQPSRFSDRLRHTVESIWMWTHDVLVTCWITKPNTVVMLQWSGAQDLKHLERAEAFPVCRLRDDGV